MKTAILCVHGFCEQAEMWKHWLPYLPEGLPPVFYLDLPGFGKNTELNVPQSMVAMAHWVAEWLDQKEIECVIWVGHSMGGYVGAEFARGYPERSKALVMFHSTFRADSEEKKANRLKTMDFVSTHGAQWFLKQFVPMLFHNSKPIHNEWVEQAWSWVSNTPAESIIRASEAMMRRRDHTDWLPNVPIPVGMIAGKYDSHIPYRDVIAQASLLQQGSLVLLENSGHLGMLEEPEKSAQAVADFIRLHL